LNLWLPACKASTLPLS